MVNSEYSNMQQGFKGVIPYYETFDTMVFEQAGEENSESGKGKTSE